MRLRRGFEQNTGSFGFAQDRLFDCATLRSAPLSKDDNFASVRAHSVTRNLDGLCCVYGYRTYLVDQHGDGRRPICGKRIDQKALAIRGNCVLKEDDARGDDSSLEEGMGHSGLYFAMCGIDRDCPQLFVEADVVEFLAICAPAWLCAAVVGYLDAAARAGKRRNKDLAVLIVAGDLSGAGPLEGYPVSIRRKLNFSTLGE